MFKTTLTAIALAVSLGSAGAAQATMYDTGHFGSWGVAQGTAAGTNQRMCEVGTSWPDDNAVFWLKYAGTGTLYIDIGKSSWNIPTGQSVSIELQVDNAPPLLLHGTGRNYPGDISGFVITISPYDRSPISSNWLMVDMLNLIKSGVTMRLYFPNGSELPWTGALVGATAALANFQTCIITTFFQPTSAPTQPYGAVPASQPF